MRGIEFYKCNSYGTLFRGFCREKYDWYIFDEEIITNSAIKIINGHMLTKEFEELLLNSESLIIFMNLQAFPKGEKARKIKDYDDFMSSPCSFVVLVSDAYCFEIYTKNDEDFLQFIKNAEICEGTNIQIKTNAGDARSCFMLW